MREQDTKGFFVRGREQDAEGTPWGKNRRFFLYYNGTLYSRLCLFSNIHH